MSHGESLPAAVLAGIVMLVPATPLRAQSPLTEPDLALPSSPAFVLPDPAIPPSVGLLLFVTQHAVALRDVQTGEHTSGHWVPRLSSDRFHRVPIESNHRVAEAAAVLMMKVRESPVDARQRDASVIDFTGEGALCIE